MRTTASNSMAPPVPCATTYQVNDEALEFRRVLDALLSLTEDDSERAGLPS